MITSMANPRVKQVIQWQTKAKERRKDKVFIIEGSKMFEEAPGELLKEVYVSEGFLAGRGETYREKLVQGGYICEEVSEEVFRKMSDTQSPQGILAVLRQPEYDLQEILQKSIKKHPFLFMILENLQDPGNLGTIMRTAEGAGVTAVIMSSTTVDLFNPKVIRATMGSVYRVPFLYEDNLIDTLRILHENGVRSYAAHLQGKNYYDSFSFREPTAFLIGNEGNGLTDELAQAATAYLKIPMEGRVESLNASVAAALLMYEAHRQRA
ncbi:MAG: RNA methyltransferase [Lachnospiraceae bacterium]|nr:RNA methyltransferase [Lachnospiraceae bacterium]MBR1853734.1 RNA methyltransferase [Lachnospiraceae bacterium]